MRMKSVLQSSALVLLAACAMAATADDKSEYDRRSAARHFSLFHSLGLATDAEETRSAVQGDLNFGPRFGDMDIDQGSSVTTPEFQRIIEREHDVYSNRP